MTTILALPKRIQTVLEDTRHVVETFKVKDGNQQLIDRIVINTLLMKLTKKKGKVAENYRSLITILEKKYSKDYN